MDLFIGQRVNVSGLSSVTTRYLGAGIVTRSYAKHLFYITLNSQNRTIW